MIISSSWHFHCELDELSDFVPETLRQLVSGATPEVEPGQYQRYREIQAFLDWHEGSPSWRALDDEVAGFPVNCPDLIVCDARSESIGQSASACANGLKVRPRSRSCLLRRVCPSCRFSWLCVISCRILWHPLIN